MYLPTIEQDEKTKRITFLQSTPIRSKFVCILLTLSFPSLFPFAFAPLPHSVCYKDQLPSLLFYILSTLPHALDPPCTSYILKPQPGPCAARIIQYSILVLVDSRTPASDRQPPSPLTYVYLRCTLTSFFAGDPECWKDQESLDKQEKEAQDRLLSQQANSAQALTDEVIKLS